MFANKTVTAQQVVFNNTQTYSQKQGLSCPNIHKILQDEFGFIWIATQDGLNKFDGRTFIQYNSGLGVKNQLYAADVRDLILDNNKNQLWVICNIGGISCINLITGNVEFSYPYPKGKLESEWKICAALYKEKIFIGTSRGLEIFDIEKRNFSEPAELQQDQVCRSAFLSDIRTITINANGLMAMSLLNKGIFFYDIELHKGTFIDKGNHFTNKSFWPLSAIFSGENKYYCGLQDGLVAVDYKANQNNIIEKKLQLQNLGAVNAMILNDKGTCYLAASNLLTADLNSTVTTILRPFDYEIEPWLKNSTSIFFDKEHNLWIGSRLGLCLIKSKANIFEAVKNNAERYNNKLDHVFAVSAIDDSTVLTGTKDGLFEVYKTGLIKEIDKRGLVQNISRIDNNTFLISGYNGTSIYRNRKLQPLYAIFPELKPYQKWQFNSYAAVNDSISLLGTESNNGVLEWNRKKSLIKQLQVSADAENRLPSNIINSIFLTKNKLAVILSDTYISVYNSNGGLIKNYEIKSKWGTGVLMHMTQAKGSYWILSYGQGLIETDYEFNVKKIYGIADGLTNTGVYSIFNHKDSLLIITSNFGISAFNLITKKISAYYEEDGLQSNVFEEASRDTFNNMFYAGGTAGYVKIMPSKLQGVSAAPILYFTKIFSEGSSEILLDSTNFTVYKYIISPSAVQSKIFFTGINYQNADRVTYLYKIKELSNNWINLGTQNFISLIGISPGTYHLQVKAANEDGVWSEPKELVLVFMPKWYQTWWFYLLIGLTVAVILYALYRYRINQIKKQHEIRKNIATDLHDDLGSTLNSVKVFTNLAIRGVKQEESLQQVRDNLTEATMSLRDMIWVLDDSLDTVDELITRLKQFAIPVATASNIEAIIKADSDINDRQLSKEEKRNLFLICKEAINNSVKYAGATKINVAITASGKKIQIVVTDNGQGFNVQEVKKGYGLKNMQYRALQIKYKVALTSSPGSGTQITILPV